MNYRTYLKDHKRIVVKVGTTTLTHSTGRLNLKRMEKLARVLSDLRNEGREVILVSSGAIAVGTERLGLMERPRDIQGKQAAAAVGQGVLMQIYQNLFLQYNQQVAQILLTKDVVENELRKHNAQNTFFTLLGMGVIPIVNENDTVATEEIEFSDNDTLSAMVARLVQADLLILLSDIDGLYSEDPKKNKQAKIISIVDEVTEEIERIGGGPGSALGTGGMATKIAAAKIACASGVDMIIASGEQPTIVQELLEGSQAGTLFRCSKPSKVVEIYSL